jgi:hypothetical protein
MRDACTSHALPYIAVNAQQMGGAIDNGGSCCPLLDCFGWSSIVSAEAVVRLPLDKLLLALVLNHACTEAADRLLRMKLDCFCWSRLSIASLDKLLLTLARKHACAEADAQLLRISTVSTEAANWLLRSTIFCWRLCWITLVLRPLVNCFGWILNVSAEAADRILRSACFCWHLCSSTLVLRHACAEAAARLFRTNLDCFCWSCWLIALLDKLLLKFFFNRSSWSSTASAEGCCQISSTEAWMFLLKPLIDCFCWSAAQLPHSTSCCWGRLSVASLDKLLLALELKHACTEAAARLLRMKIDCFCWSRYSIVSLDKLLMTFVLKHACAEADARLLRMKLDCFCWSRLSIASLDKLLLTLVLKHACAEALVNCFGWSSTVSAEAADRVLRLTSFC